MNFTLPSEPADFIADTRVEPGDRPGLYRISLNDRWNAAILPFGGIVSAIALRAMSAELGHPTHHIRSSTTVFSSTVSGGDLEIEVEPLRVGKRMSQLIATVRDAGSDDAGHTTIGMFGEARDGFEFTAVTMPEAKPPEECPPPEEPPEDHAGWSSTFFDQIETRTVLSHPYWKDDWEGGRAENIRWMRYRRAPRLANGDLDPLALVALADTMPPAVGQYLGPNGPFFYAPSCDLTVHCMGTTQEEWLLVRATASRAGEGYASAHSQIWDLRGELLIDATQLMYLRLGDPELLGSQVKRK